jgi:hypothetical protein
MVHTASTSHADQPHVPGARAVRVVGILLILQGGYRLYGLSNTVVLLFQHGIAPSNLLLILFLSAVIGLLTIVAGVLLVRQDRAGRGFGLVICSIALAHQVVTIGSTVAALKLLTSSARAARLHDSVPGRHHRDRALAPAAIARLDLHLDIGEASPSGARRYFGARLARMRWSVRRCMLRRRAVSETLRPHSS